MFYFVKTPWLLRKIYHAYTWQVDTKEKELYLTFDDGPHPEITPFVLAELKRFNAKATFFCIGKNVKDFPSVYRQVMDEGHAIGNHTYHHLNGWKTKTGVYLTDIAEAAQIIDSALFRPPYGRIKRTQARQLNETIKKTGSKVIMWDVLSGDFDEALSNESCLHNVTANGRPGSIIVFHDSEKAFPRLAYALPKVLEFFAEKNFSFRSL